MERRAALRVVLGSRRPRGRRGEVAQDFRGINLTNWYLYIF